MNYLSKKRVFLLIALINKLFIKENSIFVNNFKSVYDVIIGQ